MTGIDAGFTDRLAGALQDLFLSVGDNGFSLRETMLELSKASLSADDASFFETWLMSGRPKNIQWREGSVLTDSFSHMEKLVTPEKDEGESAYLTVLDEVQSYLEYGQIDAAQQLLETELTKTPADLQLAQELLNIYLYTRDKDSLEKMTDQLQQASVELSEDWQHVQSESANW
jgi:flagellar hook-basal body complex protein FliE